ncbi:unnamed protein product [Microthlaspi erraticum]|uniref:Uncharacterized protein n=1 Tax=Microthlaspi erraticum TaxID=1685480 RepID=A0A6D2IRU4_9BRAS|nr:unnamed protein product [Microthlaspi erraticum]CAA7049722.1 unnamed protein product [Microthlaspi erraticum]
MLGVLGLTSATSSRNSIYASDFKASYGCRGSDFRSSDELRAVRGACSRLNEWVISPCLFRVQSASAYRVCLEFWFDVKRVRALYRQVSAYAVMRRACRVGKDFK